MLPRQAPHVHSNRGVVLAKWKEALCSAGGEVQCGINHYCERLIARPGSLIGGILNVFCNQ